MPQIPHAFIPHPIPHPRFTASPSLTTPPFCSTRPPYRRVRVARKYTPENPSWQWQGASPKPQPIPRWFALFTPDESVYRALETLWKRGFWTQGFAKVTALGVRVLKSMTELLHRSWYPDMEQELVVEYGIAEPSPMDKNFVDPLWEWEPCSVTYYRDSFGRRVYLQLDGGFIGAIVGAGEYRECFEVEEGGEETLWGEEEGEIGEEGALPFGTWVFGWEETEGRPAPDDLGHRV